MKINFIVLILAYALIGCSHNQKAIVQTKSQIEQIILAPDTDSDDGPDMRLSVSKTVITDTSKIYTVQSLYKEKVIGFRVEVPLSTSKDGFGQGMIIKGTGLESTNFLNLLSDLAKIKNDHKRKFINSVSVSYVNLDQFAKNTLGRGPKPNGVTDYKLFLGTKDSQDDLELFLNISDTGRFIEVQQKDSGSWPQIIDYFTEKNFN